MLRYFFDENMHGAVAEQLQAQGVDVLTAHAAGLSHRGIPDDEVLRCAASLGRVVVTQDRDFTQLAYTHVPHAGVILLQRPLQIGELVEYLEFMTLAAEPDDERDRLTYCDW